MYIVFVFVNLVITILLGIILWYVMPRITVKDIGRFIVLAALFIVLSFPALLTVLVVLCMGLVGWLFVDRDTSKVIKDRRKKK